MPVNTMIPQHEQTLAKGKHNLGLNTFVAFDSLLDELDKSLDDVATQMSSVKRARDELHSTTKTLRQNLDLCATNSWYDAEYCQKLKRVSSEIRKREEVVKTLERKETQLSRSLLSVITDWVNEVERNLGTQSESSGRAGEDKVTLMEKAAGISHWNKYSGGVPELMELYTNH